MSRLGTSRTVTFPHVSLIKERPGANEVGVLCRVCSIVVGCSALQTLANPDRRRPRDKEVNPDGDSRDEASKAD